MTDMTESTELQAFKRQKDSYKITVKISLCICVVLSWDELKVRQSLLDSDYETYMVCLLVAAVNWHKSLQFPKKSNIALLPCLFMILLAVSMITLIMLYHILAKLGFRFIYLLYQPPKYQEMVFFPSLHDILKILSGITTFRKLKCPYLSVIPLPAEIKEWLQ